MHIQKSVARLDPDPKKTREWQDVAPPATTAPMLKDRADEGFLTTGNQKLLYHHQIEKTVL
jgi:hypothetical protein